MPYANKEDRAARDKERNAKRSNQPKKPQPRGSKFADWISIKNIRETTTDGSYFLDLWLGPCKQPCHFNSDNGQLQTSTARSEKRRFSIQRPFYVRTLRPLIEAAIEAWESRDDEDEDDFEDLLQVLWKVKASRDLSVFLNAAIADGVPLSVARQWLIDEGHAVVAPKEEDAA